MKWILKFIIYTISSDWRSRLTNVWRVLWPRVDEWKLKLVNEQNSFNNQLSHSIKSTEGSKNFNLCLNLFLFVNCLLSDARNQTFSLSSRSILAPPNSFRSRSILPNDDEYLGTVGGITGRAAIAGLSCDLLILWIVAVCPDWNVDMYEPGVERIGFVGGTGGGPVGVVELIALFFGSTSYSEKMFSFLIELEKSSSVINHI